MKTLILILAVLIIMLYLVLEEKEEGFTFINNNNLTLFKNSKKRGVDKYLNITMALFAVLFLSLCLLLSVF